MKYVQTGILASLVLIAGLLIGIYRGQQSSPVDTEMAALPASIAEEADVPAAAEQPPLAQAEKPSPLPVKRPRAAKPPRAAVSPEPEDAPLVSEPEPMPPPVITPVIPNEPPLAEAVNEPPPPQPRAVTLPQGTVLAVRLVNTLSTKRNVAGDSFEASLEEPIIVDGWLVADKGSSLEGRVIDSKEAGRVKGVSELSFALVRLTTADGRAIDISTNAFTQSGEKTRAEDMKKVGIGAGIGAIIGAIAGGGKGAAIGAGAGAGAGGGAVLATRGETVAIPTETRLSFHLDQPAEAVAVRPISQ